MHPVDSELSFTSHACQSQMTAEKKAFGHSGEVADSAPDGAAETVYRDRAGADPGRGNEPRPAERAEEERYGPRTHPNTPTIRRDRD